MARTQSRFSKRWLSLSVLARLGIAALFGAAAAYCTGSLFSWLYAPLVFWDVTALIASVALWLSVRALTPAQTRRHATAADPGRGAADVILMFASFASIAAAFMLDLDAKHAQGARVLLDIALGIISVAISWALIHLIHMLRYADLHFKGDGAVDFNGEEEPDYQDFAYLAFTIGMTYQVSDTALKTSAIRKVARQHALISYVFGTAIIASVINIIVGLGN